MRGDLKISLTVLLAAILVASLSGLTGLHARW
jgi:hypothetical protein